MLRTIISYLFALLLCSKLPAEEQTPVAAKPDQFPKPETSYVISGELTMVDHVNRMGILRPDRSDAQIKYHWDLPHHFTLLPYGMVYCCGSPTTLGDIPIGTHLHGQFFLGPKGEFRVPLLDTEYAQKVANKPNRFSPESQFSRVLKLEDDFTLYQRQGATWKIISLDRQKKKLVAERVDAQPAPTKPEGLSGRQTFDLTSATQVWQGDCLADLEDLALGQNMLFNLTWATLFGPGRLTDIWIDNESREIATRRQHRQFLQHLKDRGFPARVDDVNHSDSGAGEVTVSFYHGPRKSEFDVFKPNTSGKLAVTEASLRAFRQQNDSKPVRYLEISTVEAPPPGHSGITARFHMSELLEGVRPGRTVRVFPNGWQPGPLPREEEQAPFDIRPSSLQVAPTE